MSLLVLKFGGTSVGTPEKIKNVAEKIIAIKNSGHDVVVVVSAMGHETDRLVELAGAITDHPNQRELDVLLSSGEQVTIALLSIALDSKGQKARSYTGGQVHILTDSAHCRARIERIEDSKIHGDLNAGRVVVVAGFQGVDEAGNITTLGFGGSDTTAVALAAALKAEECRIYTDVDGVYTTDPRIEPNARRLNHITFEEMLEMASLGSKVLHTRAVEFAGKYKIPIRVLSTFEEGEGTLITLEETALEKTVISGIAFNRDEAKLTLSGIPDSPGIAARILGPIADANIEVDMIVQNSSADGLADFTFTVHRNNYQQAYEIIEEVAKQFVNCRISGDQTIAKISIVGVGMRSHPGVASKMFDALYSENINIRMISTSEIKISVVVDEKYTELGVRTLHAAFGLEDTEEAATV